MQPSSAEACAPAATHEELTELAAEMRALSYRMYRVGGQPPELQRLQKQQYWVLIALAREPRRMSDLAKCSQTTQASLTGIVDRLEEQGLVERVRSEEDRRVVEVALTPDGRRMTSAADEAFSARLAEVVAPLEPSERKEFLRLMRKLTAGSTR